MVGAHGGHAGKPSDAVLHMHHIVARVDINLTVGHRAFLYQPALLDEAEDFRVSEQVGVMVHHPAFGHRALNQYQRTGWGQLFDFGEGWGDNIRLVQQLGQPACLVADQDEAVFSV